MIAWMMRALWIAALFAMAAAAWVSVHLLGARIGPGSAALLGIVSVAALHPAAIAFNFVLSRFAGDPVPASFRLSPWHALTTYDAEIDASIRGLWFATPFLANRPARQVAVGTTLHELPILFIHGYLCNRAVWLSFMNDAAARGHVCDAVTLANPFVSIDAHAPVVGRAIDALLAKAGEAGVRSTRVAIVGHSMGGLVARAALLELGASRVGPVVTLGTPHRGTFAARFGTTPSVIQMRRGSRWLSGLEAREAAGAGLPRESLTTLFSHHDEIVYPQGAAGLDGSTPIAIGGCGHVALLFDRRVRSIVFERLDAWSGRERDPGWAEAVHGSTRSTA